MEDPSNIRNQYHGSYEQSLNSPNESQFDSSYGAVGSKLVKGLSSLRSCMDMDGLPKQLGQATGKILAIAKDSLNDNFPQQSASALVYAYHDTSEPKLLAYSPSKIVTNAVIPGGSWDQIPMQAQHDSANCASSNYDFHHISSQNIWQKVRSAKRPWGQASNNSTNKANSYWSRGRRTLKETADFFKNLPRLNANETSAYLDFNDLARTNDPALAQDSELIVNQVLANPYQPPFAQKEESDFWVAPKKDDICVHGSSDDSIRSLLSLIEDEIEDENCQRLDFVSHSTKSEPHSHSAYDKVSASCNSAIFDGQECCVISPKQQKNDVYAAVAASDAAITNDPASDHEVEVEVEVVGSSTWSKHWHQRSAYPNQERPQVDQEGCQDAPVFSQDQNLGFGQGLGLGLGQVLGIDQVLGTCPGTGHDYGLDDSLVSSSQLANNEANNKLAKAAVNCNVQAQSTERHKTSKSWGSNLYVQLCAENAPPSSSQSSTFSQAASKALSEVSQALASLLGFNAMQEAYAQVANRDEVGLFTKALVHRPVDQGFSHFVLHQNPLQLNTGQLLDNKSLAMDFTNNKELVQKQAANQTSSSLSLADKDNHELSMRAFSGKNNLNSMSSDQALSRVSENDRRSERSIYSYFMPNDLGAHFALKEQKNIRPADVLAYGIFKQWMRRRASVLRPDGTLEEANESALYDTVLVLLQTMIFAMRADGRIENDEHQSLVDFCCSVAPKSLFNNIRGEIDRLLTIDLDPALLAKKVRFPEESLDIYLLSAVFLNNSHFLELGYLENLAACLGIDPSLRRSLDDNAHKLILNYPKLNESYS